MTAIATSSSLFRLLTHTNAPATHGSGPAGSSTPRPPSGVAGPPCSPPPGVAARTPAEIARSRSDLSLFTAAPARAGNVPSAAPEVAAQWAAMARSTPDLRRQAQQIGNQLVVAILRGDSAGIQSLSGQLQNIGNILQGRSVPNTATDMLQSFKYGNSIKKMSNEELNSEWSLQSARAIIAGWRGDSAGAADAQRKLQACNTEVGTRVGNVLAEFLQSLDGMSDEQVVAANEEATANVAAEGTDATEQTEGGDDFGKMIASGVEMVGRSIGESIAAPFKFIGNLFGF